MNPGVFLIETAAILATVLVFSTLFGQGGMKRWHRLLYIGMTVCIVAAMADLFYLFLAHRFEYSYVYDYSSRDLPLGYLVSSLWAGQEGTFLLWAFFGSILGLFLLRDQDSTGRRALGFFVLTELFLLVLMVVRSPFMTTAVIPADGRGLNPLLQDPWMVIHPPVVFIGYAALALPFAQALGALISRRFEGFATRAFPWVAFSVASLGAGIFIGGFWAYKVLGWGGYWGWDPVENSSLIPWLTALALLHGLILFRMQPKLLKTNLTLALVSYLLVVYGTFLTRSGVLADFSVHSFADLGINAYLIVYMIGVTLLSLVMLVIRTRGVPAVPISRAANSREFGLVLGMILLLVTSALVLVGTSAPLLTRLGGQASNVTMNYYTTVSLPLSILIVLTLTFSPFLMSGLTPWGLLLRHASVSIGIAAVATIAAMFLGVNNWEYLLLVFGASGAFVSNLIALFRYSHGVLLRMPGHLTHLGFAVMLVGILASSAYSVSQRLALVPGQTQTAFGYDITFNRLVRADKPNQAYLDVNLVRGNTHIQAKPRLYFSDYTQSIMRNPHVVQGLIKDIYLAPIDYQEHDHGDELELAKGKAVTTGDWTLTFERYSMGQHGDDPMMSVAATVRAVHDGDTLEINPTMTSGPEGLSPVPMTIPGTDVRVALTGMRVESQVIHLTFKDPERPDAGPPATLALDVATKPLISWVWAGIIVISLGSALSFVRRWRERDL